MPLKVTLDVSTINHRLWIIAYDPFDSKNTSSIGQLRLRFHHSIYRKPGSTDPPSILVFKNYETNIIYTDIFNG